MLISTKVFPWTAQSPLNVFQQTLETLVVFLLVTQWVFHHCCLSSPSLCQQTLETFLSCVCTFLPQFSWTFFLYAAPYGPPKDHADPLIVQQV